MSLLLEILRCILCCEQDYQGDDIDHEFPHRSASSDSRPLLRPSVPPIECRVGSGSGSSYSVSYGSASIRSVERTCAPIYSSNPTTSSFTQHPSFSSTLPTSAKPPIIASSNQHQSSLIPVTSSSKSSPSLPKVPSSSSKQTPRVPPSSLQPESKTLFHSKPSFSSPKPAAPSSKPTSSSPNPLPSFKPSLISKPSTSNSLSPDSLLAFKPTLLSLSPDFSNEPWDKTNYIEKDRSHSYVIPEAIKDLLKKDKVPEVLKNPVSPSTYKDYFSALLYAEDFYIEKWSDFQLVNVQLKLHKASISNNRSSGEEDKIFVAFEIESAPEKRPFLLSRDFVFARPSTKKTDPFQGILYRVLRSNLVLVEFGEDFRSQHKPTCKYDVSFSFNRVCLKRAHQAIEAASSHLFRSFIFPDFVSRESVSTLSPLPFCNNKLNEDKKSAVSHILRSRGPPAYLVDGPLSDIGTNCEASISPTGVVVQEAILQIYRSSSKHQILICAPTNKTCDVVMRGLNKQIPESHMFRANAVFREVDGVPEDILPLCLYKQTKECFACHSIEELKKIRVVLSTFVSSFQLYNEGIAAGYYSHIFLLDASSAIEPEVIIPLALLATKDTAIIVTGATGQQPRWVRSDIARRYGLKISYFERLCKSKQYRTLDPMFITNLVGQ